MEARLTHIIPMYPTNYEDLGTFKKERPIPYTRHFLACALATMLLALFATASLCKTRLVEIERHYAADARV